jgi:hypothetical protein
MATSTDEQITTLQAEEDEISEIYGTTGGRVTPGSV